MNKELIHDPRWVSRMENYFDTVDKDRNGIITIFEIQQWATNMESLCKPTANEMVKLRAQLYVFWGKLGLKADTFMKKEDFIKGVNILGSIDIVRARSGQTTFLQKMNDAYFDVADFDKSGAIALDELQTLMVATGLDPRGVGKWLKEAEKDKDGSIDRQQFFNSDYKFWYGAAGV